MFAIIKSDSLYTYIGENSGPRSCEKEKLSPSSLQV